MSRCTIPVVVALVIGAGAGYFGARYMGCPAVLGTSKMGNDKQCQLYRAMDKLWAEHVLWTRQFIVSAVAGLGDVDVAAQRLLKNQEDIGNAIVPVYGEDAGKQLTKLLKDHILIAADLVKAAIAKDNAKVKDLDAQWHANAQDIAAFLSGANPNWPQEALVSMLNNHLELTTKELQYRLKQDWKTDITNYDKLFDQAHEMGNALSEGIIKQFPDKL